jgi:tetratricopeptide (TPR) repeat protein
MPLLDELTTALAGRYAVQREIGRGGMAVVFLAHDVKHDRDVAIKVLHPELSAAVSATRFEREIHIGATLQHPLILPLYESGQAGGLLFYVMPFVEGESLKDRMTREGQLPVTDALRIVHDVADALAFAHAHGIVHRDIKPANILLSGQHALVADFGIARALHTGDDDRLTSTGLALGTPAYMSPEQAAGEHHVDARTDIYALGCVAYEMLAGEPPFTGPTTQSVIARHMADTPRSIRIIRPAIPPGMQQAIERALAKVPADRYETATAFAEELTHPGDTEVRPAAPRRWPARTRRRLAIGAVAAVATLGVSWAAWARFQAPPRVDPDLVAIAPFDVLDPELGVWREGLLDLLSRSLNGAGPLRTVSASTVMGGWTGRADAASAEQLGRRTGAGLGVAGNIVREGRDSVRLSAALYDVNAGTLLGEVQLTGHLDRMGQLVDSLALGLIRTLSQTRPIGVVRLASAHSASLPGLKAFLRGEQFLRATQWDSAESYYERAAELDTTFALAFHRIFLTRFLRGSGQDSLIWKFALRAGRLNRGLAPRESLLVAADSLFAAVWVGMGDGDARAIALQPRLFSTLDQATRRFPEDPQAWYQLGVARMRVAATQADADEEILGALERSIALDSAFAPAYIDAIDLVVRLRGVADARRYLRAYLALKPAGPAADAMRLFATLVDPHQWPGPVIRRQLDTTSAAVLYRTTNVAEWWFDSSETAILLARLLMDGRRDLSQVTESPRWPRFLAALMLGKRGHAREAFEVLPEKDNYPDVVMVLALMGAELDDSSVRLLNRRTRSNLWPRSYIGPEVAFPWFSRSGDSLSLTAVMRRADSLAHSSGQPGAVAYAHFVSGAARAHLALIRHDTSTALQEFLALPDTICNGCDFDRITLARLLLSRGRAKEAAAVLNVRLHDRAVPLLGYWSLERARAFEALGDTVRAVRYYSEVADMWLKADPALQPIAAEARAARDRLLRR